jgi:hypothetical protein
MEDHHPAHYSENRDVATMAKPANFSGVTTAESTYRSSGVAGSRDSWLDIAEQKVSSSLFKKNIFTGNVATGVVKEDMLKDGDEVFFEGKRFYFVDIVSATRTPAVEDFLASVTAATRPYWVHDAQVCIV